MRSSRGGREAPHRPSPHPTVSGPASGRPLPRGCPPPPPSLLAHVMPPPHSCGLVLPPGEDSEFLGRSPACKPLLCALVPPAFSAHPSEAHPSCFCGRQWAQTLWPPLASSSFLLRSVSVCLLGTSGGRKAGGAGRGAAMWSLWWFPGCLCHTLCDWAVAGLTYYRKRSLM